MPGHVYEGAHHAPSSCPAVETRRVRSCDQGTACRVRPRLCRSLVGHTRGPVCTALSVQLAWWKVPWQKIAENMSTSSSGLKKSASSGSLKHNDSIIFRHYYPGIR